MKKILLLSAALGAALCANADALTVNHTEAGKFAAELSAACTTAGISVGDVTDLTIISAPIEEDGEVTGYAYMNKDDFTAIRANLRPSLLTLDLSAVKLAGNATPDGRWDSNGILNQMNLTSVKLPEGLTALNGGAFQSCAKLVTVEMPNTIRTIGSNAFKDCKNLELTTLPEDLVIVGASAFINASKVAASVLPAGVTDIEEDAFNATSVSFSVLPEGIKHLGVRAFRNSNVCFKTIPENFTQFTDKQKDHYFGTAVFVNCKKMTDIVIPEFLWNKIPDQTYYIDPLPTTRTILCRSLTAPDATVDSKNYYGVFGRADFFPNDHLYILKDAEASYAAKSPWSTMKMHFITTPVEVSIVGSGADVAISHEHYGDKVFQAGTHDIYEGSHQWTLVPTHSDYYITAVYYEEDAPAAAPKRVNYTADDNDAEEPEAEEPTDGKQTLYKAEGTPAAGFIPVNVSVPVTAKAGKLSVEYSAKNSGSTTGLGDLNAQPAFVRNGNTISVTEGTATLYDIAGKAIVTAAEIDLTNLTTGVYIIRCGAQTLKIAR